MLCVTLYCAWELTLGAFEIMEQLPLTLPQLITAGDVRLAGDRIRSELELLGRELIKVEDEIAVVNTTIQGLPLILGADSVRPELMEPHRPRTRRNIRGLSGCRRRGCISRKRVS